MGLRYFSTALFVLALLGCGSRQEPRQFQHGVGHESADAKRGHQHVTRDAGSEREPVPPGDPTRSQQPPCGLPSSEANPWPCGAPIGVDEVRTPEKVAPEPSDRAHDKPGSCEQPECGKKAKPIDRTDYESEFDRPDYCGTPGCGHDDGPQQAPPGIDLNIQPPPRSPLESLRVGEPSPHGYSRKDWKHWIDEDQDCQDTRQEVLIQESEIPVTFKTKRRCKVIAGRWTCPYTGEVFTDPSKLDIDHMVPLGAAHAAGGHNWSADRRMTFANDLGVAHHLIAVKASANRSKGKKGPGEWLPPNQAYVCEYIAHWVSIKATWQLEISAREKLSIERSNCIVGLEPGPPPSSIPVVESVPSSPKKRCTKGKPCGNSCIAKSKICRK